MKGRVLLLVCIFLACAVHAYGQNIADVPSDAIPFTDVPIKPQFNGKDPSEFAKFLAKNIVYPKVALDNGIQGRVMIRFIINTDGSLSDITVTRSVEPSLDKEAVRAASKSPKWSPGRLADNTPVKVVYLYPVAFYIR